MNTLLDTIKKSLDNASKQFVYGARFTVKPLGAGYQVDCMESDAKSPTDAARGCLLDEGLDVFEVSWGVLHVQERHPLGIIPMGVDDEDDEELIRAELAREAASHAPEYDSEVARERCLPWM